MNRREFGKKSLLVGAAVPFIPSLISFDNAPTAKYQVFAGDPSVESFTNTGYFSMKSNPVFVLTKEGQTEVLTFNSDINFTTGQPRKNRGGFRVLDISVKKWEGVAFSKLLNKEIAFKVSESFKNSSLTSKVLNQDFPSDLSLHLEYDLYVAGSLVKRGIAAFVSSSLNKGVRPVNQVMKVDHGEHEVGGFSINFCAA
jgi:hypothetical protein